MTSVKIVGLHRGSGDECDFVKLKTSTTIRLLDRAIFMRLLILFALIGGIIQ